MSAGASGQNVEVRLASVSGRVAISGNARASSVARRGELLRPGDTIDTHGGGRVRLELSDGSVVIVQPETRLMLQDYRSTTSLRQLLNIFVGRVRIKVNRFGSQPNPYRVNSPTASIAVRGTDFGVAVGTDGETRITVNEGLVEVSSLSDPQRPVLVKSGQSVIVRYNEPIRFFVPGPDNLIGERDDRDERTGGSAQTSSARRAAQGIDNDSLRSAAGVYDLYIDSIADSGETPLPSRFAAFPDSHFDSLENPSYATEFTTAEGRALLLPSFNSTGENEAGRLFFGSGDLTPINYNLSPQFSFFKPFSKQRSVIGGSVSFSRNGFGSFTLDEEVDLPSPPFPTESTGSQATIGRTTNTFFAASLVAARRFGADGRTSIGVGLDFLSQRGSLLDQTTRFDESGLMQSERVESRSRVERMRFTVGLTRDIGAASKAGIFYRYGNTSADDRHSSLAFDGDPTSLELVDETSNLSEIGVRLRGSLARRLFYGVEGGLLFGKSEESIRRAIDMNSREHATVNRATLGFGVGYAPRPRTVFSFDVSGGFVRAQSLSREDATGNVLEDERETSRFLSLHAALQADVWRRLFVSGSALSVTQSQAADFQLFPDRSRMQLTTDGVFVSAGRSRDRFTDYFSNFGVGWRFTPDFLAQYIFSTDFGRTSPHHTFLLRYTFNIEGNK